MQKNVHTYVSRTCRANKKKEEKRKKRVRREISVVSSRHVENLLKPHERFKNVRNSLDRSFFAIP